MTIPIYTKRCTENTNSEMFSILFNNWSLTLVITATIVLSHSCYCTRNNIMLTTIKQC